MRIPTTVQSVQFYRSGCTVSRSGTASLKAGSNLLCIDGLTRTSRQNSLRLQFPKGVTGMNIQIKTANAFKNGAPADALTEESEQQRIALEEAIQLLVHQIGVCDTEMALWKQNGDFTGRTSTGASEAEAYIRALPSRLDEIYLKKQKLQKEKDLKEKELKELLKCQGMPVVYAEVHSDQDLECPFILTCYEENAFWETRYEVIFEQEDAPLTVRMRARIVQNTGEDWKDADVTLFTGNPALTEEIPELSPIVLRLYVPAPYPALSRAGNGAGFDGAAMATSYRPSFQTKEAATTRILNDEITVEPLRMPAAQEEEKDTMIAYHLPGTKSIASGSDGSYADLSIQTIPAEYTLTALPRENGSAYFAARVRTADWPLPKASAEIYVRDTYGGSIQIAPDMTKETFLLSLGKDQRVQVSRRILMDHTQEVLLKGRNLRKQAYEITVSGSLSKAQPIQIMDQIPISSDKAITVEPVFLDNARFVPETGMVTWYETLYPGQMITRQLSYNISWPKDRQLQTTRRGF